MGSRLLDCGSTSEELEKRCKTGGIAFVDVEFPPVPSSLFLKPDASATKGGSGSAKTSDGASSQPVVTWKRASDILNKGYAVYVHTYHTVKLSSRCTPSPHSSHRCGNVLPAGLVLTVVLWHCGDMLCTHP